MKFQSREGLILNIELEYRQCSNQGAGDFFLLFFSPRAFSASVPYQTLCELTQDALMKFHEESEFRHDKKMAYRNRHLFFTSIKDRLLLCDLQASFKAEMKSSKPG